MDWLAQFQNRSLSRAVRSMELQVKRHGGGKKGLSKTRKEWGAPSKVWRALEKRIEQGKL